MARRYLRRKGHRILEANFRCSLGEIDLVTENRTHIHIVEVKSGIYNAFYRPRDHLNYRKYQKLRQLAAFYLSNHLPESRSISIDLVEVVFDERAPGQVVSIEHFENILL